MLPTFVNILPKTNGPISTKLHTKHSRVIGIQVCSNEGSHVHPLSLGDISKKRKDRHLKPYSPEPLGQFHQTLAQSILVEGDSGLFK